MNSWLSAIEPDPDAVEALAPTTVLRAGINLSNSLLVNGTGPDGEPIGVSPSMATAVAEALDVPIAFVTFPHPGQLADGVGSWDIGNIGADPARASKIAFSRPYCEIEATYLVRGDSGTIDVAAVDRPGARIVAKARAAYTLWLERHLDHAELVLTHTTDESFERFAEGEGDALAGLRPRLDRDQARMPDSRVLTGRFMAVQQAIGTPRDRAPAGAAFLERFVASALESGFVAELIAIHQVAGLSTPA